MQTPSKSIRVVSVIEATTLTGPAKNMIRFARSLRNANGDSAAIEFTFATFVRGAGMELNDFIQTARQSGIEVDVITERRAFDPGIRTALADIIGRRKPDILQTHMIKSHFLVRLSAELRSRQPWLAFHHGYTTENLKMRLYNELNRISLPAASKVVTVCRPFADILTRQGVKTSQIEILPNSVDPLEPVPEHEMQQIRRSLGASPEDRILLSIGRFSSEKGHADLIPAMAHILQAFPGASIKHVLVGDGIERRNIEQAVANAGLGKHFVFAGHQKEVRPFYAIADLFVLPSHSEGSPNVLLEAMAAGLPIVATAVGGVPDTVRHERSALLVQAREPASLAKEIVRLLSDPHLAGELAQEALREATERFSSAEYRRALISLYQRIHQRN